MRFRSIVPALLIGLLSLTGCAQYEFDLVRPPELARHISEDHEDRFKLDPLEYGMQAYEGRLIIKIYNPTNETISLDGARSYAVDPQGESHPLRSLSIAPSSWAKLILPPLRPHVENSGPNIGFGFGIIGDRRGGFYSTFDGRPYPYDEPRYYDVYIPNDSLFWDWEGQTDVRLLLVYQRGTGEFRHQFTFHRRRM
jgi:hypothetical protein